MCKIYILCDYQKNDNHLVMLLFDLGLEKLKEHSKNSYMHSYFVFYSFGAIMFEGNFISYNNRNEANVRICEGYLILDHFHK